MGFGTTCVIGTVPDVLLVPAMPGIAAKPNTADALGVLGGFVVVISVITFAIEMGKKVKVVLLRMLIE